MNLFLDLVVFCNYTGVFSWMELNKPFQCKKTRGAISWEKVQLTVKIIQDSSLIVK